KTGTITLLLSCHAAVSLLWGPPCLPFLFFSALDPAPNGTCSAYRSKAPFSHARLQVGALSSRDVARLCPIPGPKPQRRSSCLRARDLRLPSQQQRPRTHTTARERD
ncbi:unnamed protein product, partial [Scytosiphon promiscuus]